MTIYNAIYDLRVLPSSFDIALFLITSYYVAKKSIRIKKHSYDL